MKAAAVGATAKKNQDEGYTTSTRSERLRAALSYAARGWPVFPCKPGGKEPLTSSGFHDATTDPRLITAWWSRWPAANVAGVTGPRSGILAVDVDDTAGLDALEGEHGPLPKTRTHSTGSGGMHYLYRYPEGVHVRNSAGKLAPGLDVRAAGGYIVLPPSTTTRPYEVLDQLPLADAPGWLLKALSDPHRPRSGNAEGPRPATSADEDGPIPEGQRNASLFRFGCGLRARGSEAPAILEALDRANRTRCEPPLPDAEVSRIAESAAGYEVGTAGPATPAEVLEALDGIQHGAERRTWPKMSGATDRDVYLSLIKAARLHGREIPAGVRIQISVRALALAAATSKRTVEKAIGRLKVAGLIRSDNGDRAGTRAGAFVLLSDAVTARAKVGHSTTHPSAKEVQNASVLPLRAPRLRWSAPDVLRLGKVAGAVIDALEAGPLTLSGIAAKIGNKRPRDLRRRQMARLVEAGVVECFQGTYRLTSDWLHALNEERDAAGEIAAFRRDAARFNRERVAYGNRGKVKPGRAPTEAQMEARRRDRERRHADGVIGDLERLPAWPDGWSLTGLIGSRVRTRRGSGRLWDHKGDEARVVLDSDPNRWHAFDVSEIVAEGAA